MDKNFKEYTIFYAGLKIGTHKFEYNIEGSFFDCFDYSEISKGKVKANLELEKESNMLVLSFSWDGFVEVPCDRCSELFNHPVNGNQQLIIKFGSEEIEDNEEIVVLPFGESQFNVAQYIYEFISLSLPIQKVHGEDEDGNSLCDEKTLKILDKLNTTEEKSEETDPRWDALKKFNN